MDRRGSATTRLKEVEKRERRRKGLPPLKEDHLVGQSSRWNVRTHFPFVAVCSELADAVARTSAQDHQRDRSKGNVGTAWRDQRYQCKNLPVNLDGFRRHFCVLDDPAARLRLRVFQGTIGRLSMSREDEGLSFSRQPNQSETDRIPRRRQCPHGCSVQIAWAMSKGVKDRFKDYWDAEHGCTYIPYAELKDISNFSALAEGGTIDDESTPASLKGKLRTFLRCD